MLFIKLYFFFQDKEETKIKKKTSLFTCHKEVLKTINDNIYLPVPTLDYLTYSIKNDTYTPWSPNYLKKVVKDLIANQYVVRSKKGYMREKTCDSKKRPLICFDKNGTNKKRSDLLMLTRQGTEYLQKELHYDTNSAQKTKKNISGKMNAQSEERIRRSSFTNIFFKEIENFSNSTTKYSFTPALDIKRKTENRSILGSKFFGIFEYKEMKKTKKVIVYNSGCYVTRVTPKVEAYLTQWLGTVGEEQERIVLAENPYSIAASLEAKFEKEKNEKINTGTTKLLVDAPNIKNYYFNLDIGGIKQLEIFKVAERKEFWKYIFSKNPNTSSIITPETIANAEFFNFTAQTETQMIYIGYEQELNEIIQLLNFLEYTDKQILIICLKEQKRNYEVIFEKMKNQNRLNFITTNSIYGD